MTYSPNALLTGSVAYGNPTKDSDVDLVVFVTKEMQGTLCALFPEGESDYDGVAKTIRCGRLQLILVTSESALRAWETFTRAMEAVRPVTREQAKAAGAIIRGHMWPREKSR